MNKFFNNFYNLYPKGFIQVLKNNKIKGIKNNKFTINLININIFNFNYLPIYEII